MPNASGKPSKPPTYNPEPHFRCIATVRLFVGGAFVTERCIRDGRHHKRRNGHVAVISVVDAEGRPIRRVNGNFQRVRVAWDGDSLGEGVLTPEVRAEADAIFREKRRCSGGPWRPTWKKKPQ